MDAVKESIDLSNPILIEEFCYNKINFKFRKGKYSFPILFDHTSHYYVINDDFLNVHVFAITKKDLAEELKEQIYVLWQEYALEKDSVLTEEAINIKKHLLENIETSIVA